MQTIKAFLHSSPRALCSIHPDQTVWEALQALAANNIGALVVLEGTKMVGIFSERDYARRVELKGRLTQETRVRDVMVSGSALPMVGIEAMLGEAVVAMSSKGMGMTAVRYKAVADDLGYEYVPAAKALS